MQEALLRKKHPLSGQNIPDLYMRREGAVRRRIESGELVLPVIFRPNASTADGPFEVGSRATHQLLMKRGSLTSSPLQTVDRVSVQEHSSCRGPLAFLNISETGRGGLGQAVSCLAGCWPS
jgi:hypothetical protein